MRSKSQILSKLRADGQITDEEYKMLEQEPCEIIHGCTYGGVSWGGTYKPQEPKTGHWKRNETIRLTYCSECGFGQHIDEFRTYNYCPNCGACMKDCRTLDEFIEDSKESEG